MCDSFWPDFDTIEFRSPKEILIEQANFLLKKTNDVIFASILEIDMSLNIFGDDIDADFGYKFLIRSKYMDRYRFEVFTIYHNIAIYPVTLKINNEVREELNFQDKFTEVNNEEEFKELLKIILNTGKIKTVVGSLLKLSSK